MLGHLSQPCEATETTRGNAESKHGLDEDPGWILQIHSLKLMIHRQSMKASVKVMVRELSNLIVVLRENCTLPLLQQRNRISTQNQPPNF
jgi:hypothetical protein